MLHALEQICRMRGGAQAHLMRCSDGNYYVVKFQNNPQHRRVLVKLTPHDFLPDEKLREVTNIGDFAGMLVFDQ